jgi:hypothetical protein
VGFRNPVSTIGALDTGQGFARGSVQSYTDNPTGALGSALHTAAGFQFRDGVSGDTPAAVVNVANYTAQGANGLFAQGGGLTVAAGSYNGVQGPRLDLNVESAPAGGYAPVLRMTAGAGGRIVPDTALDPLVPATALPLNGSYFSIYGGSAYAPPTFWKLADGLVVLVGMVTLLNANFALGATVGTLPPGCRPSRIERFTATGLGNGAWIAEVMPSGAITYAGASSGSPAAGSYISLAGITFPAEQ